MTPSPTHLFFLLLATVALPLSGCHLASPRPQNSDPVTPQAQRPGPGSDPIYDSWERLSAGQIGEDLHGVPMPDGSGIVFSSNRHSPRYKLYLRESAGNRTQRLTSGAGDDAFPAISPDGKRIAFASTRDGRWQIYLLDGFEDNQPRRLSEDRAESRCPSWSPDGKTIVYSRRSPVTSQWEIWMLELETGTRSAITEGLFPVFSPDGTHLAFQRHRRRDAHHYSIWTIRRDGTHEQEITSGSSWGAVNPSWSPNGRWIAFNSVDKNDPFAKPTDTGTDLYLVRVDGTGLRRLTFRDGPEWRPHWGIDNRLYFSATVAEETAIWGLTAPALP